VMGDAQKINNTLEDEGGLTSWTKCDGRWSEIQQHLARQQSTHLLTAISYHVIHYQLSFVILKYSPAGKNPCISFFPTWLPLSLTLFPYICPLSAEVISLHAFTHVLWHSWVSQVEHSTDNPTLTS
jgi:hypothetical protein